MDVRTGRDVQDGQMPIANGYTQNGWLSTSIVNWAQYPFPEPTLKLYRREPDSANLGATPIVGVASYAGTAVANDESAMLYATYENTDLSQNDGDPRYSLDLLDLNAKTSTRLVDKIEETVTAVALSPHTLAWVTRLDDGDSVTHTFTGPAVVHIRPRSGGPVVTYTESADPGDTAQIAATDAGVGYVVHNSEGSELRTIAGNGSGKNEVGLPDGSYGIAAVGSRFLTAAGGRPDVAGVYSVSGTAVTRTATVPTATYPITALVLNNSVLHYADASASGVPGDDRLWQRGVSGSNRPSFGADRVITVPGGIRVPEGATAMSFSAGRGAVKNTQDGSWHLLDRGNETGAIPGASDVKVSGSYVLSGGRVYRPDGELVWSEPLPDSTTTGTDDLFGSTLVYSRQTEDGKGDIWAVSDVEHPDPQQIGEVYPTVEDCYQAPRVAIWGEILAWGSACSSDGINLRNLRSQDRRDVYAAPGIGSFVLGEGTLAWQTPAGTDVLNLRAPAGTAPIVLPGSANALMLDDHRIARQLLSGGRPGGYDVQNLSFDEKYAPRLIAPYATGGFTPDGDGHADTWTPQFDITKPLKSAELSILDSTGKVVRKLAATAPDGSIRDLSWDGRNSKGVKLPVGTYQWQLTGRADDGDGTLIDPWGRTSVRGAVEISAV
jgi:hypothetical protein